MIVHTELEEMQVLGHFAKQPLKIDRCHREARSVENLDAGAGEALCKHLDIVVFGFD